LAEATEADLKAALKAAWEHRVAKNEQKPTKSVKKVAAKKR
jgi:hypothetical protein